MITITTIHLVAFGLGLVLGMVITGVMVGMMIPSLVTGAFNKLR